MSYLHIDIKSAQTSKKVGDPCGDAYGYVRCESATTLIVCDGLGSGVKANINATLCLARAKQLIEDGISLRKVFSRLVKTMESAKGTSMPYAVFTLVRITNDGNVTVLSYEMPNAILVTKNHVAELQRKEIIIENTPVYESTYSLNINEGIIVVSDGITESGLGELFVHGWGTDGVVQYANFCINNKDSASQLPQLILEKAVELAGKHHGDDCTVAMATCRKGKRLNILTGPPKSKFKDIDVAKEFSEQEGYKIICGGKTAEIYAKAMGLEIKHEKVDYNSLAPPHSYIDGIDLVAEGAITLNQVFRLIDENLDDFEVEFTISELYHHLRQADFIKFIVGNATNTAHNDISFRQRGLLPRIEVIRQLANNLANKGKLVIIVNK